VQGIVLVVISATVSNLKPNCPQTDFSCPPFTGTKGYAVFMVGLYIIGLGTGMLRPCLAAFGADQFDLDDPQECKKIRSYFNWLYFSISVGAIIAIIAVIYVAENVSWPWGFGMVGFAMLCSTLSFLAGIFLYRHQTTKGSPLTRMAQVLVASLRKRKVAAPADSGALFEVNDTENNVLAEVEPTLKRHHSLPHTKGMHLLDRAAVVEESQTGTGPASLNIDPWRLCTVTQVEEVKSILRCIPVALANMLVFSVVAQMQTWFVNQGYTMKRHLGPHFSVPPPSLSAVAIVVVLIEIAIYDRWFVPLVRKYTGHSHGITHLQRIGIGMFLSVISMACAAVVETIRLHIAHKHGIQNDPDPRAVVPMSIFWLLPQWILLASAELFSYVGLLEFFWSQTPMEMRSLGASFSFLSISLGFFQSGALIAGVNSASKSSNGGWLADSNLNKNHLNYFYIVLMVASVLNFGPFFLSTWMFRYVKFARAPSTRASDNKANSGGGAAAATDSLDSAPSAPPHEEADFLARSESRTPLRTADAVSFNERSNATRPPPIIHDAIVSPLRSPRSGNSPLRSPTTVSILASPLFSPRGNYSSPTTAAAGGY
jgi:peptide/histidine transporter 3/4